MAAAGSSLPRLIQKSLALGSGPYMRTHKGGPIYRIEVDGFTVSNQADC